YASFKRRMYRLGHISFFGLAMVNFMFYLTVPAPGVPSLPVRIASWAFIVGAVAMPLCCLLMAHFPRTRLLFSIPVLSLLLGGVLMVMMAVQPQHPQATGSSYVGQRQAGDSSYVPQPNRCFTMKKIGFIAMSGVRAHNEELTKLG